MTNASVSRSAEVEDELVRLHYRQIPAIAIAPTAGAYYTAWVLWGTVPDVYLQVGLVAVTALALVRVVLFIRFRRAAEEERSRPRWRAYAVIAAALSGCVWGSAAVFLYPIESSEYQIFLHVLLALVPIIPVAALAVYLPAFFAYFLPCILPFIATLAQNGGTPQRLTALLLTMMMVAMIVFARRYAGSLAESVSLRLELARRNQALEQSNGEKARLIATASHDLRQPVHAMGMYLESLRRQSPRPAADWFAFFDHALASLRGMLEHMLDLTRLDANVVEPQVTEFSARDLLDRLHAEFSPHAARRRLEFRIRGRDVSIRTDRSLLERIVRNLIANAFDATTKGGILIACRARADCVLIQVWDTGVGIPPDQWRSIFEEFTRLRHAEVRKQEGLGLGLAIVRRLCGLLGHEIRVSSRPGRGTVFTVDVGRGAESAGGRCQSESWETGLEGVSVLVVDDDEHVLSATSRLLARWGCVAGVAKDSDSAIAQVRSSGRIPQVLVIDHHLGDGVFAPQVIARLESECGARPQVIVITADTAAQRIREAFVAGHVVLHKPVAPAQLHVAIAEACGRLQSGSARL